MGVNTAHQYKYLFENVAVLQALCYDLCLVFNAVADLACSSRYWGALCTVCRDWYLGVSGGAVYEHFGVMRDMQGVLSVWSLGLQTLAQ